MCYNFGVDRKGKKVPDLKKKFERDIRKYAEKLYYEKKLMDRKIAIASGDLVEYVSEQIINGQVKKTYRPASVHDQLVAINSVEERIFGKSPQSIMLGGDSENPLPFSIQL